MRTSRKRSKVARWSSLAPAKLTPCLVALLFFLSLLDQANGAVQIDDAKVREISGWLPAQPCGVGEPATNRAAWEKFAFSPAMQKWFYNAEATLHQPIPKTSDDLYLDFSKTGNRDRWQTVEF